MRVENTSDRQYDVHALPKEGRAPAMYSVPRASMGPGEVGKIFGSAEIPDDVLAELLAKEEWTKAVFASGDLVAKPAAKAAPASDDKGKPAK